MLVTVAATSTIPVRGQSQPASGTGRSAESTKWTPPRTPWGDPDLSGIYSNSDESGIPFERPARFEGRRNEDLTPQELEALRVERRKASAASSVAEDRPVDREVFWENLNAVNSRGWLVVDPPDGKIPPTTAARATARRGADGGTPPKRPRTCRLRGGSQPVRPVHHEGRARLDDACHLRQLVRNRPGTELRGDCLRDGPRGARDSVGLPSARRQGASGLTWETHAATGRAIRWSSRRPTSRTRPPTGTRAGETLRLIERFKAVGPNGVEWSVTVDDPATWTRPWTFAMMLTKKDASQRPFEYACHEGNYGLRNILSAARAEEALRK